MLECAPLSSVAHTSEVIAEFASEAEGSVTVEEILSALGDRVYALLIVVLGIPNCLPMPPPIPLICGLLLAFVAPQLALGRRTPWIPRAVLTRSVKRSDIARVVRRAVPLFEKLERYSRPRLVLLVEPIALRVIGLILMVLAVALICSPPIFGQMPLGFAICLIGLGLVERDGLIVLGGILLGCFGVSLSASFIYAVIAGIGAFLV